MEAKADVTGPQFSIPETFAQLRGDLSNDNFLSELKRLAVDDLADLNCMVLANLSNLHENKWASNSIMAVHSARTCLFGTRQF